ncbi:MAG: GNAT family N-acetyltransferase [Mesorhizobium sp.]|nr:MAG: GNAT family N-acetyltransferase [Mesorhizobium sp.]
MVDATASFDGNRLAATEASSRPLPRDHAGLSISVASTDGLAAYAEFCRSALFGPAQSAAWVQNWAAETRPDLLVATLSAEGKPVFSLALEVAARGPFRIARFMGGRHANGNFVAADPNWLAKADIPALRSVLAGRLLDAFFEMKELRFRKMGIANVFGDAQVRGFFRALFMQALAEDRPSFVLHGLEVAGKLRAITGSSRLGKRLICEFGAIAEDDLGHASPGDFLFFDNIQEACETGFEVYDFSVGDEPYKRLWCDIETRHFEVLVPLTVKGRMLALTLRQGARLKAFVKNSPTIWKLTKVLRRKAAGQAAPAEEDS